MWGPDGSPWVTPESVAAFVRSPPNAELMRFAAGELRRVPRGRALDVGCGAGRNLVPLALQGWRALGTDLSLPMLAAAARRAGPRGGPALALAPMDRIPARDGAFDLIVAHGIWNLARSGAEMRRAMAEAARVAAPDAALFLFTFSRNTLPPDAQPVAGETFVFTQFSGAPQCFLTAGQLGDELAAVGFRPDPAVELREYNRSAPRVRGGGPPAIYEAGFRRTGLAR
jgi:SAM-dependent methyltransferase